MKYPQIMGLVFNQPWAILPGMYTIMQELLLYRAAENRLTDEEIATRLDAAVRPQQRHQGGGAVAVLPLQGVISQRMNMMADVSGGTSTEQFGAAFNAAMADPAVVGIVIDIDSPGGAVVGVQELWSTIMSARGQKPIVAMANSMAASAAYWIATAADEIIVTPGGDVGSIGVLTAHHDFSAKLEMDGERITVVSAGKKKADLNPFAPLSERGLSDLQGRADEIYSTFVSAVAQGRGKTPAVVRSGFGEGGMVAAKEAVSLGMADRIGTMAVALERASNTRTMQRGRAVALVEVSADYSSYSGEVEVSNYLNGAMVNRFMSENLAALDSLSEDLKTDEEPGPVEDLDLRNRRLALQELTKP